MVILGACGGADSTLATEKPPEQTNQPAALAWRSVAATTGLTCALDNASMLHCIRSGEMRMTPVAALIAERFDSLSTNDAGVCALGRGGAGVRCVTIGRLEVTTPTTATGIVQLAGGPSVGCVLAASGAVSCWDGHEPGLPVRPVTGLPPLTRISYGLGFACGLTADGAGWCWSTYGTVTGYLLGGGTPDARSTPVSLATIQRFVAISAGTAASCALTAAGEAYCWGDNTMYEVGVSHAESRASCQTTTTSMPSSTTYRCFAPERVTAPVAFRQIQVMRSHACALAADGRAYCWGSNVSSSLGVATVSGNEQCRPLGIVGCTSIPTPVNGGLTFARLGPSQFFHQCAVTSDGQLYCWGGVSTTGSPDGGEQTTPVRLPAPVGG